MLTARNDSQIRLHAFRLGIDDFLTKPFDNKELVIRIENALNNYQKRTQFIHHTKVPQQEIKESNKWFLEMKEYICKNCKNLALKQADIAIHLNVSESTLYRKIKSQTGLSPNNLIKEIRLQKAKDIINDNPEIMLKQLALEVGFAHTSYFSKIYEKRFGVKPLKKIEA